MAKEEDNFLVDTCEFEFADTTTKKERSLLGAIADASCELGWSRTVGTFSDEAIDEKDLIKAVWEMEKYLAKQRNKKK